MTPGTRPGERRAARRCRPSTASGAAPAAEWDGCVREGFERLVMSTKGPQLMRRLVHACVGAGVALFLWALEPPKAISQWPPELASSSAFSALTSPGSRPLA